MGVCLLLHDGRPGQTPASDPIIRINPNTAPLGQLLTLPGMGPVRAEAIVSYREAQPHTPAFASLEDLTRVHGLGPALVRDMASWLSLDETSAK